MYVQSPITSVRTHPQKGPWAISEQTPFSLSKHLRYICRLVAKGGPEPADYDELDLWHASTRQLISNASIDRSDAAFVQTVFGDAMSTATLQGWTAARPRGYPGDFELADRVYTHSVSPDPRHSRWDRYFQPQPMPRALRERTRFFHHRIRSHPRHIAGETVRVLVAGAGAARDVHTFLLQEPFCRVRFRCIDFDPDAIEYARRLNAAFPDHVVFQTELPPRGKHEKSDLIWAPGIFDYYDDKAFQLMLRALLTAASPEGCIVIAGLAETCPGWAYMEFCRWIVRRRSPEILRRLAWDAGLSLHEELVHCTAEGPNLYLIVESSGCARMAGDR